MEDGYPVGEVARLSHVSVRTLHHYDEVGLLRPGRTGAGYRRYTDADLRRLRRILVYRSLEFGLDEIARLLDDPAVSVADHLRRQRELLRARIERYGELLAALDHEQKAQRMGIALDPEEQFEVFGTDRVGGEWAGPRRALRQRRAVHPDLRRGRARPGPLRPRRRREQRGAAPHLVTPGAGCGAALAGRLPGGAAVSPRRGRRRTRRRRSRRRPESVPPTAAPGSAPGPAARRGS